jgi:hypothetical protein
MIDGIFRHPQLCKSHRIKTIWFSDKSIMETTNFLKSLWITFLVILSLFSTVLACALINASMEFRETKRLSYQDPKFNTLNKTIQEKIHFLLESSSK